MPPFLCDCVKVLVVMEPAGGDACPFSAPEFKIVGGLFLDTPEGGTAPLFCA